MNKWRRKKISEQIDKLEEILGELDDLANHEREAFYYLPEPLQRSRRGMAMVDAFGNLDSAFESIRNAEHCLKSAIE